MATPENPYGDVIEQAGGPFRVKKGLVAEDLVARALFDHMKRARTVCDQMGQTPPTWMVYFSKRIADVMQNPELMAQVATAYAAARNEGFVVEPENLKDTPCGKSAAQVFDALMDRAVRSGNTPTDDESPRDEGPPRDVRYQAPQFGFNGPDLRAVWSSENGEFLIEFLALISHAVNPQATPDCETPVPPAGSIELWRAFLDFQDPLKADEATVGATAAESDASAEGASPEEATPFPEWVTAEDRRDRLDVLCRAFQEQLHSLGGAILRTLLTDSDDKDYRPPHYDVEFLMGFDPERMSAVLPHLMERARLFSQNLALFQETDASLQHCALPTDPSVHTLPPHELVARCWLTDLEDLDEAWVKAVFEGSIDPRTFSILRTYFGEEDFRQLDVDKIRFADRFQGSIFLVKLFECIGADAFKQLPLPELKRIADLESAFFEAVVASPALDGEGSDDDADEAEDTSAANIVYQKALSRLRPLGDDGRTAVEDFVLQASQLYARTDHEIYFRRRDDMLSRGLNPRIYALNLIRTVPAERLAKLSLNHHAALLQHPELADRLDTLETIPEHWLELALNVHLKDLPRLDDERIRQELVDRPASADDNDRPIPDDFREVLAELRTCDGGRYDDFDTMVRDFPAKMRALLTCPDPAVLCDFVESCGGVDAARRELGLGLGLDDSTMDEGRLNEAVALMVQREEYRSVNHMRGWAASEPHVAGRRLPITPAFTDPPEGDLWYETPKKFHSSSGFEFGDVLRYGYTPEQLATLAGQHRFVARLVQFIGEQRQAAEAKAKSEDLVKLEL